MGTRYEQMRRWTSSSRRFGTDSWSDLLISSAPSSVNPHQLLFFRDITCRSPVLLDNLIISRHQVRDRRDRIGDECPVGYLYTRRFVLHGKSAWLFCVILRALWSNYWPHIEGRERSIAPNQRHSAPTPLSCPLIAIACYLSSDLHTTQPSPVPLSLSPPPPPPLMLPQHILSNTLLKSIKNAHKSAKILSWKPTQRIWHFGVSMHKEIKYKIVVQKYFIFIVILNNTYATYINTYIHFILTK